MDRTISMALVIKTKAIMLIAWGLWLLSPWWNVFDYGPQYHSLESVMGENAWGAVFALFGTTLFVMANSRRSILKVLLFAEFFLWTFLTTMIALGEWRPASTVIYGAIAFAALIFYIAFIPRAGDDDAYLKEARKNIAEDEA